MRKLQIDLRLVYEVTQGNPYRGEVSAFVEDELHNLTLHNLTPLVTYVNNEIEWIAKLKTAEVFNEKETD
jgi:hypothetical protein